MDQLDYQRKSELECYQRMLNGIIAINMGTAIIPFDNLSSWEGFIDAWVRFQKENEEAITAMIHQFGKDQEKSAKQSPEDEAANARGKFLEDVQKLGFPVNIQGPQALAMRRQEPLDLETKKKRRS